MKVLGEGSIVALEKPEKTCKKWQLRVAVGLDAFSDTYKVKTRRVRGSKKTARILLREFIEELEDDGAVSFDADKITLGTFAKEWLEERRTSVNPPRAGTLRNDEVSVRTIDNAIGGVRLADLNAQHIATFYRGLVSGETSLSRKPLSGASAHKKAATLQQILDVAVRRRLIPFNPCSLLEKSERPKVDTPERMPLTDEDAMKLIDALYAGEPESHTIGALLAIELGCRREELLGLSWGDVDLQHGIVHIQRAYTQDELQLMPTKSKMGDRFIPIYGSPVHKRLIEWREVQSLRLEKLGMGQDNATPVVTSRVGGRIVPNNFYRWWRKYCEKCGIAPCGLHTLRHTYATALGRSKVDLKTIQKLLGDSTGAVALNIYQHYVEQNGADAMSLVSGLYHGGLASGGNGGASGFTALEEQARLQAIRR